MEDAHLSNDARKDRDPKCTKNGAADVHAHHTATFRRIQTVAFGNNGNVGLTVNGVARTDSFALHAHEESHWQPKDKRTEEMTEFLNKQSQRRVSQLLQVRTDI